MRQLSMAAALGAAILVIGCGGGGGLKTDEGQTYAGSLSDAMKQNLGQRRSNGADANFGCQNTYRLISTEKTLLGVHQTGAEKDDYKKLGHICDLWLGGAENKALEELENLIAESK